VDWGWGGRDRSVALKHKPMLGMIGAVLSAERFASRDYSSVRKQRRIED